MYLLNSAFLRDQITPVALVGNAKEARGPQQLCVQTEQPQPAVTLAGTTKKRSFFLAQHRLYRWLI